MRLSKKDIIELVKKCIMLDTGVLTPLQAAEAMKQTIIGCLEANLNENT